MKRKLILLHGIVLAIGCPIILYGHPIPSGEFAPANIIQPSLFSVCLYIIVYGGTFIIIRNANACALIGSIAILGILYPWPIFVFIFSVLLIGISIQYIRRKKINFGDIHLLMNMISILVVGYFVVQFTGSILMIPWADYRNMTSKMVNALDVPPIPNQKPDVYYIILDGYSRADVLKILYDYDNSAFINALEQRGFTVASQSRSNYPRTLLSVASSLNMQYLNTVSETMGESSSLWPVSEMIQHSTVRIIFENSGYQTVFFADEWDYSDIRDGDVYVKPSVIFLNAFDRAIISHTNLQIITSNLPVSFVSLPDYNSHRRIILNDFARLAEIAKLIGPKFIYAHIVAPHPPFVFNSKGDAIDPNYGYTLNDAQDYFGDTAQYKQSYLEQLTFVNMQTLNMIDGILANSNTPPVIIIQADHGPAILHYYFTIDELSTFERYSILNAYYLPGVNPKEIPQDITPVNSFRFIFNKYFNANFGLLPNRQYFPTGMVLYQFQDVTDRNP
jgi:hypothetical protein